MIWLEFGFTKSVRTLRVLVIVEDQLGFGFVSSEERRVGKECW